jgi:hypothetical protein
MKQIGPITLLWLLLIAYGLGGARAASVAEPAGDEIAASPGAPRYDIGTPTLADLWVDPANGGDGNSGATREQALRSITEAWNRAVDFVAVQHGHIVGNRVHNAQDWCMYQKGGSAYFRVEGNEFYDCGTGGFTAGQGTGFQFMTAPWLHYEAYDIKVVNNLIHDTAGAGLGVNGGYNILLAYNTLYRVGVRDHVLEIVHGRRGCDGGDAAHCQPLIDAGGWGLTGDEAQFIPNRNVYVYNNIIYNPAGYQSSQQFDIRGPVTPPPGSNAPNPAYADDGVRIRGNLIWNGPSELPLGIEDSSQGCQDANPTCNAAQLRADNAINTLEPQLANPRCGDFHPLAGGNVFGAGVPTFVLPTFAGGDQPTTPPVPPGTLENVVGIDRAGATRATPSPPGAYIGAATAAAGCRYLPLIVWM